MKKIISLFVIVLSLFVTGCSVAKVDNTSIRTEKTEATNDHSNQVIDYDGIILNNAAIATSTYGFDSGSNPFSDGSRYFNVTKNSDEEFVVDVNGTVMIIRSTSDVTEPDFIPINVSDVSSRNMQIVNSSKKLVFQYINESTLLKDKIGLKNYIDGITVKEANYTGDLGVGAYFSYNDNCIYINRYNMDAVCEWMITHELIHAISYYTHGCNIDDEEFAVTLFNEVITDIITAAMKPEIPSYISSGYSLYYDLLYPYINCFGKTAINAYFYGYDEIYDQVGKDEFEFFVIVINNFGSENSEAYYNNMIIKWYSKL